MTAPSGYRDPKICADSPRCSGVPKFVEERLTAATGRHQAEYKCPKCGLVHIVADTPSKKKGGAS